ncbi:hypothetical protein BH11BAC4_BH11BAC4_07770 [soil metagenome]
MSLINKPITHLGSKPLNIGLFGYGVVGKWLFDLLHEISSLNATI